MANESIGDIPTGFANILESPEQVAGTRDAGRSLLVDAEATLECVVARRTAGERRGIVVESQTWTQAFLLQIIKKIQTSALLKKYLHILSIVLSRLGETVVIKTTNQKSPIFTREVYHKS